MMKKIMVLISRVFVISLLFSFISVNTAITAETIKIGAVLPLADITGKDASRSMQLAVKQINATGGLLGKQVELVLADDENKPDKVAAAIEKLVNVDKVDVIVGGTGNATTMEAIPVLKKYAKVTVWSGASSAKVDQALEDQDWFFHIHPWDYELGAYYEKMWQVIVQKYPGIKRKKTFVAYREDPFGSDILSVGSPVARAYLNVMQGEVYTTEPVSNLKEILSSAKNFVEPDIFIWDGLDKDAILILEEAKNIGFAPPVYLGKTLLWPLDFGKQMGSEGVMFYSYWHESMKLRNKACLTYVEAFNKEFKESPVTYFGPLAYTNIMIVADAVKRAGSLERGAFIKALEATNYDSPLGDNFVFVRSLGVKHQAGANPKLMQWQGGEVKIIWPWELATAKLIYPFPAQGFNKEAISEEKAPPAPAAKKPAAKSAPAAKTKK